MSESTVWISFLYGRAQDFFLVCSDESKDFLGRAVDNWTHEGASSWCRAEKIKKFLPPGTLKMHSSDFSVFRFHFKTFSKLLKFRLRNTLLGRCFWKGSYIQIKYVYIHKLVRAANQFQLKSYSKYCSRNQMKQCRLFTSRRKRWILLPEKSRRLNQVL